jgi:serine/threonine kinase PknH
MFDAQARARRATAGPYRIEAELGRGGMGVVYRALHVGLDAPRAVKFISDDLARDPAFRRRFEREARLACRIRHPHVATVLDFGEHDGTPFLVMDLIDGEDLALILAREGALAPERAVALVEQVAGALDAAHAQGLVHRDVKPPNILVAAGDCAFLTDFGVSREIASATELTQADQALGTPQYMAPEQFEGAEVDGRADVYALGCVLYQLLTGRSPGRGQIYCDLPTVGAAGLDAEIRRARARRPKDRHPTAGEFAVAARAALAATTITPVAPMTPVRAADTPPDAPTIRVTDLDAEPTPTRPVTPPRRPTGDHAVQREPRSPGASRRRGLAPLAAVLAAAALAVFGATQAGGGRPAGGGGQPTPTPTATATAAPASPERALLAHVPPDIRPSCESDPGAPEGTRAALACTTTGADELHYYDFGTAPALQRYYDAQVAASGASPGFGDCASGNLPAEQADDDGRALCHEEPEGAFIEWTRPALAIYAVAHVYGPYNERLLEAWQAAGPA